MTRLSWTGRSSAITSHSTLRARHPVQHRPAAPSSRQLFIITPCTLPISCSDPSGQPSPPSRYQSLTDSVFWNMTSLRRSTSTAATCALLCIMKRRPTWSEELASPRGCRSSAEPSSSAAEFTAPAASTNRSPRTSTAPSGPSATRWSTRRPVRSVTILLTRTPVSSRALPGRQCGVDRARLGVALGPHVAGESVTGPAATRGRPVAGPRPSRWRSGAHPRCATASARSATYGSCGRPGTGTPLLATARSGPRRSCRAPGTPARPRRRTARGRRSVNGQAGEVPSRCSTAPRSCSRIRGRLAP